ncbi:MAG: hypothetical protein AAFV88_03690 [Planctomycetota bacterium]
MRLPVVMPQSAPAKSAAVAEALIGSLIGRPGLDLTLVDRLDAIEMGSTDQMTLEGITVPVAVLNWESTGATWASLERINFHGTRTPHRLDPDADGGGSSSRRLFLFDLVAVEKAAVDSVIAELDRLRESLSVRTFSLDSMAGAKVTPNASKPVTGQRVPPKSSPPSLAPVSRSGPPSTASESEDAKLDDLIDQLDDLDV